MPRSPTLLHGLCAPTHPLSHTNLSLGLEIAAGFGLLESHSITTNPITARWPSGLRRQVQAHLNWLDEHSWSRKRGASSNLALVIFRLLGFPRGDSIFALGS